MTTAGRQAGGLSPQHPPAPASEQLGTDGNSSGKPQAAIKKLQKPRGHRSPGQPVAEQAWPPPPRPQPGAPQPREGSPWHDLPWKKGSPRHPTDSRGLSQCSTRATGLPARPHRGEGMSHPPGRSPHPRPHPCSRATLPCTRPRLRLGPCRHRVQPEGSPGHCVRPRVTGVQGPRRPSALCARTAPASTADACSLG